VTTLLLVLVTVMVCASAVVLVVGFIRGCRQTSHTFAERETDTNVYLDLVSLQQLAAERARQEIRARLLRARPRSHDHDQGAA